MEMELLKDEIELEFTKETGVTGKWSVEFLETDFGIRILKKIIKITREGIGVTGR